MAMPEPVFAGGWITGRFRGAYEAAGPVERAEHHERRALRLLRGTLEQPRFVPFGPADARNALRPVGPALRQDRLRELWVPAGTDDDGHPRWQPVDVADVHLYRFRKLDDDLIGAVSLGEIEGELWAWIPGLDVEEARPVEPPPEVMPDAW
jgi:hypothetical protein